MIVGCWASVFILFACFLHGSFEMNKIIPLLRRMLFAEFLILLLCFNFANANEDYEPSTDLNIELAREETRENLR